MSVPQQTSSHGSNAPDPDPYFDNIANDVNGCIYAGVQGFYAKYFGGKPWSALVEGKAQTIKNGDLSPAWWSQERFLSWLSHLQASLLGDSAWHEKSLETSGSPDRALVLSRAEGIEPESSGWAHVLVVGAFCSHEPYLTGLVRLCRSARAVFASQPDRLFLHGFYMCRGTVELWVFDRCGMYSCEAFDAAHAPHRLLTALLGYTQMDDSDLGVGPLIKHDTQGRYMVCGGAEGKRLYLGEPALFARVAKNIVTDGLSCYRARLSTSDDWEYAVKVKWSPASQKSELEMLELAKERKIEGVLRLFDRQSVCSTDDLHTGLVLGAPRKLSKTNGGEDGGASILDHSVEAPDGGPMVNMALACTVVWPLGESLHKFETVSGLLEALRDAVKAHRRLYQDAGILHRDICPGNIIVPLGEGPRGVLIDLDVAKKASEPGKQFEGVGTLPFQAIGVLQAYLPDNPPTYRHDLESFLYTLLFLATCKGPVPAGENQLHLPRTSVLHQWTQGRPVDEARCKTKDMDAANFGRITAEFQPEFEHLTGLAEKLRGILFPVKDGKLWTGTDMTAEGTDALYDQVIDAFATAAREEGSRGGNL